jgi:DNA polymerase Ligase (LigD)
MSQRSGRFVVLEHDHPHRHWDFMLEADGVLRTWRLPMPPADGLAAAAEKIADHRLAYLDHDGPVSGDRGVARPWDKGDYVSAEEGTVVLAGRRWSGTVRMRSAAGSLWSFEFVGG